MQDGCFKDAVNGSKTALKNAVNGFKRIDKRLKLIKIEI